MTLPYQKDDSIKTLVEGQTNNDDTIASTTTPITLLPPPKNFITVRKIRGQPFCKRYIAFVMYFDEIRTVAGLLAEKIMNSFISLSPSERESLITKLIPLLLDSFMGFQK